MKQYIVDAFTNKPFSGNPAAVCVIEFNTLSGKLTIARKGKLYEMDFSTYEQQHVNNILFEKN